MNRCILRRYFLALSALIVVIAIGVACSTSIVQRPPQPSTEKPAPQQTREVASSAVLWKDFSSDQYGIQFRYPDACGVSESNGSFDIGRIQLAIFDSAGKSLADYVTDFVDDKVKNGDWRVDDRKTGVLGGRDALTVEYRFGGQGRFGTATFVLKDQTVYVWGLTAGGFICDEPEVYEQVLATFRFSR